MFRFDAVRRRGVWFTLIALCSAAAAAAVPTTTESSTTQTSTTVPAPPAATGDVFDASSHLTGDWFGARTALYDRGISIDPSIILDDSKVFRGGLNTHDDSPRYRLSVAATIDTQKLLDLPGGTFFALFQEVRGTRASTELVGDAQNFAFGTDFGRRDQLTQLWYQQQLLDGKFAIKVGKMDANADFDVMDNAQEFLNASWGANPTMPNLPSYPETATGVALYFNPARYFYAEAGVFDGSAALGVRTGEYGPAKFLNRGDNLFTIAEIGTRYDVPLAGKVTTEGKLGIGGWFSTDPYPTFGGPTTHGTGGFYLTADQVLWKPTRAAPEEAGPPGQFPGGATPVEEDPRSIALSLSLAHSESDVNFIDNSVLAGLAWVGPLPFHGREHDVMGIGVTAAGISSQANVRHAVETSIEGFYRLRLTQYVSLKPDLQYIFHPSGGGAINSALIPDVLVGTLRIEISF